MHEPERAHPHALVLPIVYRDHVHGDVPRLRVLLQQVEHVPAIHARELDVQHDRIGLGLLGKRERRVRVHGDQSLETRFVHQIQKSRGECHVIFDDQNDPVTGADVPEVVPQHPRFGRGAVHPAPARTLVPGEC